MVRGRASLRSITSSNNCIPFPVIAAPSPFVPLFLPCMCVYYAFYYPYAFIFQFCTCSYDPFCYSYAFIPPFCDSYAFIPPILYIYVLCCFVK